MSRRGWQHACMQQPGAVLEAAAAAGRHRRVSMRGGAGRTRRLGVWVKTGLGHSYGISNRIGGTRNEPLNPASSFTRSRATAGACRSRGNRSGGPLEKLEVPSIQSSRARPGRRPGWRCYRGAPRGGVLVRFRTEGRSVNRLRFHGWATTGLGSLCSSYQIVLSGPATSLYNSALSFTCPRATAGACPCRGTRSQRPT